MKGSTHDKDQIDAVFEYMRDIGPITSLEASMKLGCGRLASRICDIKEILANTGNKYHVVSEMVEITKSNGKKTKVKRYWLEANDDCSITDAILDRESYKVSNSKKRPIFIVMDSEKHYIGSTRAKTMDEAMNRLGGTIAVEQVLEK